AQHQGRADSVEPRAQPTGARPSWLERRNRGHTSQSAHRFQEIQKLTHHEHAAAWLRHPREKPVEVCSAFSVDDAVTQSAMPTPA
ncbi:MAG: hypothetical protein RR326_13315, partial [Stenotrophomonas sp.]